MREQSVRAKIVRKKISNPRTGELEWHDVKVAPLHGCQGAALSGPPVTAKHRQLKGHQRKSLAHLGDKPLRPRKDDS